ncbi:unnamed protein product [Cyprideis torosa]|uniref:Uncharacterized protein n=1 Tax=Cyprideis torosa TaxID=163714 RepID=A0A7R8ZI98_9CRUS|nr:unnamed protein product [Cyprideis torosa]CAG0885619.1 unnamed protein product [Cyprideis torosa]
MSSPPPSPLPPQCGECLISSTCDSSSYCHVQWEESLEQWCGECRRLNHLLPVVVILAVLLALAIFLALAGFYYIRIRYQWLPKSRHPTPIPQTRFNFASSQGTRAPLELSVSTLPGDSTAFSNPAMTNPNGDIWTTIPLTPTDDSPPSLKKP